MALSIKLSMYVTNSSGSTARSILLKTRRATAASAGAPAPSIPAAVRGREVVSMAAASAAARRGRGFRRAGQDGMSR
ncbi:hypothetical protein E4U53_007552 [Claviceps sorghi]|nr:hypothetical protein E4U53_007552 [Claviceps sorghi]